MPRLNNWNRKYGRLGVSQADFGNAEVAVGERDARQWRVEGLVGKNGYARYGPRVCWDGGP